MENPDRNATPEIERVTQVPGETESPTPPPRQKDPQRVSAGRAGAAARKAKQEQLLEELRSAKEAMQRSPETPAPRHYRSLPPPKPTDTAPTESTMTLWIVGAGLVMLALWTSRQHAKPAPPASPAVQPAQHVKVDPFYME